MHEEKNIIVFSLQIIVLICSGLYVLYIIFAENYFKTTPPALGIMSMAVALLYFCGIGYSKFSVENLDKHHLNTSDRIVYYCKFIYVVLGILVVLCAVISLFFVKELSVAWSDGLSVLTLMFTLSVELLTYGIFLIAKSKIVNYRGTKK